MEIKDEINLQNAFDDNIYKLLRNKFGIIGESKKMLEVINRVALAAPTDLPVLITGETGTGKEVFANAIHGLSNRKKFPFISVNCGAIPETLLESELFGNEKGAFTGAIEQRKGFFEVADKGTIFLDEIGEMPIGTQVKLLRVLESGEFTRLGSTTLKKVDVRIIAATNRDLETEIEKGNFRRDLFFRLNSVHITLPPLREHPEDIKDLVNYFAEKTCAKLGLKYDGISNDALLILERRPWTGNIRELKNLIETLVTLEQATFISQDILKRYIPLALPPKDIAPQPADKALVQYVDYEEPQKFELEIIFRSLLELKHDITNMFKYLRTLENKIDDIGLEIEELNTYLISNNDLNKADTDKKIDFNLLKLDELEKRAIIEALKSSSGNRRIAANLLGISERTLYRKINELNINNDL
ncbi:MAG: sigma-54 dependent transcriptional regulator [Candidatus Kapabacteria bacterium]|nr:sigma-54 dependent transcriptional regulator [Candidatus Kapabacteria bacterium]